MLNIIYNMNWSECKSLISQDYHRLHRRRGGVIGYLVTNASFRVTFWYRIGSWLRGKRSLLARISYMFVYWLQKHYQLLTGIQLIIGSDIKGGLTFPHFSGIVISDSARIGRNCTILQGVTIGGMRGKGVPVIGDNCVLFAGAKVIGKVKIGNNVAVGAGAVVIVDVPDNAVVVGVPAKIVSYKGKEVVEQYFI